MTGAFGPDLVQQQEDVSTRTRIVTNGGTSGMPRVTCHGTNAAIGDTQIRVSQRPHMAIVIQIVQSCRQDET